MYTKLKIACRRLDSYKFHRDEISDGNFEASFPSYENGVKKKIVRGRNNRGLDQSAFRAADDADG